MTTRYRIPNLAPEVRYNEIMFAVEDAIEKAHADDSADDISIETERAVDLVRRMVREALRLPQLS